MLFKYLQSTENPHNCLLARGTTPKQNSVNTAIKEVSLFYSMCDLRAELHSWILENRKLSNLCASFVMIKSSGSLKNVVLLWKLALWELVGKGISPKRRRSKIWKHGNSFWYIRLWSVLQDTNQLSSIIKTFPMLHSNTKRPRKIFRNLSRSNRIRSTDFMFKFNSYSQASVIFLLRFGKSDILSLLQFIAWATHKLRAKCSCLRTNPILSTCIRLRRLATPLAWKEPEIQFRKHFYDLCETFSEELERFAEKGCIYSNSNTMSLKLFLLSLWTSRRSMRHFSRFQMWYSQCNAIFSCSKCALISLWVHLSEMSLVKSLLAVCRREGAIRREHGKLHTTDTGVIREDRGELVNGSTR